MPHLLLIETSTDVCSVAVARGATVAALRENAEGRAHAKELAVLIDDVLRTADCPALALDAIAVSEGPGSYTGLRVGVSMAKGLGYGLNKPLLAVSSLQSLAQRAVESGALPSPDCLIAPMIDARRREVYTALFDAQARRLSDITAEIVTENSFADALARQPVLFLGDGAAKCRPLLQHPNARFADLVASATGLLRPALAAFRQKQFADVAYFEPFYLKDFVITKKKPLF
jgi:tRNA threonylcarbamoyladenosine biosynthesis protein TsaB